MPAAVQNSPNALCGEILAEARRQCDAIAKAAEAEAEHIVTATTKEVNTIRHEHRQQAEAEAARRRAVILATLPLEVEQLRSRRVDSLLTSIRDRIRARIAAPQPDASNIIADLAAHAIRNMSGDEFTVSISAQNRSALPDLAAAIAQRAMRTALNVRITANDEVIDDGAIIESADGSQVWDNRLSARLQRLWPELRRLIAARAFLHESAPAENSHV